LDEEGFVDLALVFMSSLFFRRSFMVLVTILIPFPDYFNNVKGVIGIFESVFNPNEINLSFGKLE
jgi:hypothetical protein